ncbi:MAG: hypothetical protein KGH86_04265 [Thaumarchaeota archaeon]|nr:hypothetical protein [Nitrososphaerota archaeon]MDE1876027.1 hypothetical protein [Nitrososphaerota archaeon]
MSEKGIQVLFQFISKYLKKITFAGDYASNIQLDDDLRTSVSHIDMQLDMDEKKTRQFTIDLGNTLKDAGENVRVVLDKMCIIESFQHDKWIPAVCICHKGLRFG